MILNEYKTIAYNEWMKLPGRFKNFELDVFRIMPNRMHGIIVLNDVVSAPGNYGDTTENEQPHLVHPIKVLSQGLPQQKNYGDDKMAGASPAPTTLVTLWVHTNHWWQMCVWKYSNQKMK